MQAKHLGLSAFLLLTIPSASIAADRVIHLPFDQVVTQAQESGKLDGSVKFYLSGKQPAGQMQIVKTFVAVRQRTDALGRKDDATCQDALSKALVALQKQAKAAHADAVVDIVSDYGTVYSDPDKYECHVGNLISGVQLKGKLAKLR